MTNVYTLRPDALSHETVKCLSTLHTWSKRGVLKGIAFVAYIEDAEGADFVANAAGEALVDPTNTIGMLRVLEYKLAVRLIEGNLNL